MSKVDFIQKDKKNTFHGYKYTSEQAIKETLHKLLVEHKVLFTLEGLKFSPNHQPIETEKDTITNIEFKYHFWDIESGEELSGNFVGSGEDKGDKGTYKAITGAVKYIMTSTFLIPTGDDPEDEKPANKPNYAGTQYENRKGVKQPYSNVEPNDIIPAKKLIACVCGKPRKFVPPGISKTGKNAGKPYKGFYACTAGKGQCNQPTIQIEDAEQYLKNEFKDLHPTEKIFQTKFEKEHDIPPYQGQ